MPLLGGETKAAVSAPYPTAVAAKETGISVAPSLASRRSPPSNGYCMDIYTRPALPVALCSASILPIRVRRQFAGASLRVASNGVGKKAPSPH